MRIMESPLDFVSECIYLAVNSRESKMVNNVNYRRLEEPGCVFSKDKIEISSVSPPGDSSYVLIKYKGQPVLEAEYINGECIELANGTLEWQEDLVKIGFIKSGEWENKITELYRSYFKK